jgi:pyridoxamine 5'-phosphate oxidase
MGLEAGQLTGATAQPTDDDRLVDLDAIEARIWAELERAVRSRFGTPGGLHPWRRAALATIDADGAPQVRSVVLRDLQADARELVVYADARSAKVAQLRHDSRGQLLCWSEALGWQLRLQVRIEAETSGLDVTARWARIRHSPAAHDYLSPLPPGTALGAVATPPATDHPRESFAVLTARVEAIDWLELHARGHRRARFDGQGAVWLVP